MSGSNFESNRCALGGATRMRRRFLVRSVTLAACLILMTVPLSCLSNPDSPITGWSPSPRYLAHFALARQNNWIVGPVAPKGPTGLRPAAIPAADLAVLSTLSHLALSPTAKNPPVAVRKVIEDVLKHRPHFLLSDWYDLSGQPGPARDWMALALSDAPVRYIS